MSVKDEHEMDLVKSAATLTCAVFKSFLVPQVVDLLEKDKKISHAKLSEKVEECILDPSKVWRGAGKEKECNTAFGT